MKMCASILRSSRWKIGRIARSPFRFLNACSHRNELDIVLPQQCGVVLGEVGPQQIASFPPSDLSQLLAVEGVTESRARLVHRDIDQAPCGGSAITRTFVSTRISRSGDASSACRTYHADGTCHGAGEILLATLLDRSQRLAVRTPLLALLSAGRQVHDADIVATMLANSIERLLTFNASDFRHFASLISVETP